MAVRLHMTLGVVAEHDRLPDSPDTLVVVEPSVGSVARSKGHLYLLVTSRISSRHALEATRLDGPTLDIEADAPIVAQELRLRRSELLAAFAAAPGSTGIHDLRVHVRAGGSRV